MDTLAAGHRNTDGAFPTPVRRAAPVAARDPRAKRWTRRLAHDRLALLALVANLLFALACTALGRTQAGLALGCNVGCAPNATTAFTNMTLTLGPLALMVLSAIPTIRRARLGHRRAWLPAIVGCIAQPLCVAVGSFVLGVA